MAKRLTPDIRHRIHLDIERVMQCQEALRDAQVQLVFDLAKGTEDEFRYWLRAQMLFDDGSIVNEKAIDAFILKVMSASKLRLHDIDARTDLRPSTQTQRRAIERMGGKKRHYTYAEAEQIILSMNRKAKHDKRTRDSQTNTGRRTPVPTKR